MNVGSLFSGIGGIELGFEKAGDFETKWFIENNEFAKAVLRKHWSKTPIFNDIRGIRFKDLPRVDILTGGFPCQDISNAGKRRGIEGERSGLWKEYLRAISEIRPRYAFVENVSALTYRGLLTVLGDLAEVGYDAEWHCVPASALGAPHRRDRVYILAYRNSHGCSRIASHEVEERCNTHKKHTTLTKDSNVSNVNFSRQSGQRQEQVRYSQLPNSYYYYYWKQRKESLREKNRRETWATDAGILRMAHGIPHRVDRIKCLGNAVVPQVAEFFAEIIKEKERGGGGKWL